MKTFLCAKYMNYTIGEYISYEKKNEKWALSNRNVFIFKSKIISI